VDHSTVLRPFGTKGFLVLPKRWIVERTFAWIGRSRRHSKDYEMNPETSETMILISMIHLMLRRLELKDLKTNHSHSAPPNRVFNP
jgi:putative transposase